MRLDWIMLANHAETPDNGLLYLAGGGWDTTTIHNPLPEGAPDGAVALLQGHLVVRLLFHVTETDREHGFTIAIMDEDGHEVARIDGSANVARSADLPVGWDHGINLAIPLTGMPVPRFGLYSISVLVDGQHVGDRPFRVLKGYD